MSPTSLSLSLSPSPPLPPASFITKSSIFGIQRMFPLPEGDSLLGYNYLLSHSALSHNTLLYLIELFSRWTKYWTGSTSKPLSGPVHTYHYLIVRLSLHIANNIKKCVMFIVHRSSHKYIVVSHVVLCVVVLGLLCLNRHYPSAHPPQPSWEHTTENALLPASFLVK